jgi:hypothetical protein
MISVNSHWAICMSVSCGSLHTTTRLHTHTPVESGEVMLMGDLNCRRRREKEGAAVFTVISMTYTS